MEHLGAALLVAAFGVAAIANLFLPDRASAHRNRVLAELAYPEGESQ